MRAHRTRGFVLLNALVLVSALAAVGVLLLARASDGQARRMAAQDRAQTLLYLDGFEALARTLLDRDARAVDHAGESWAQPRHDLPLDRGLVQGQLVDLQGRFNVNWVANPEDEAARAAFLRLAADIGLTEAKAQGVIAFLTPGGAAPSTRTAQRVPAVAPPGGPVVMLEQLLLMPGLRPQEFARLVPHVAALPGDSTLNLNTASDRVMAALLPGVSRGAVDQLIQMRRQQPFASLEEALNQVARVAGVEAVADIDPQLLGVASHWFEAEITATIDGTELRRRTVFQRQELPLGTRVAYRLSQER